MIKLIKSICLILILISISAFGNEYYPNSKWEAAENPESFGWSSKKLELVKKKIQEFESDAFLMITNGKIILSVGDIKKSHRSHSIRKSFLSALYGIYVNRNKIDITKTLADLKIDDSPISLTKQEKKARIVDLMKARSGIYLPAGSEIAEMRDKRPKRGSHKADTFWYYNNWDMNVLGTIFEKKASISIFEAFKKDIAKPIGMQDFDIKKDTRYKIEPENSKHRSYKFKISARDLARFGLLYLRKGKWKQKQIIPASWILKSTKSHSKTDQEGTKSGYGYMWWITIDSNDNSELKIKNGTITASGYGGQRCIIIPDIDTVIVHMKDIMKCKDGKSPWIGTKKINTLLNLIIDARIK